METINISILSMIFGYLLLFFPIIIFLYLKIKLVKETFIAVVRMTLQLLFVGFYLQFVFELNFWWLNLLWVLIMIAIANGTVVKRAHLKQKKMFIPAFPAIFIGSFLVLVYFIIFIVHPNPLFDARYVIPLSGMILGNCLRGNVIALERFYSSLKKNHKEYFTYLTLGATRREALLPYLRESLDAAISPTIATIATIGLVSLPGMMTGVILGGASPIIAIKYQIMIMLAIFSGTILSAFFGIVLSLKTAFSEYQILRLDIFV
jgi:putative ABC transport system permease protein